MNTVVSLMHLRIYEADTLHFANCCCTFAPMKNISYVFCFFREKRKKENAFLATVMPMVNDQDFEQMILCTISLKTLNFYS